jgi:hypothetical protein
MGTQRNLLAALAQIVCWVLLPVVSRAEKPPAAPAPRPGPRLLVKGNGYLLHLIADPVGAAKALATGPKLHAGRPPHRPADVLALLTYTALPSGKMTILARTGTSWSDRGHHLGTAYHSTSIRGVVIRDRNVFVLTKETFGYRYKPGGRSTWRLTAFDARTGKCVDQALVAAKGSGPGIIPVTGLPKGPVACHPLVPGALRETAGGVDCFGTEVRLEKGKLKAVGKTPATKPAKSPASRSQAAAPSCPPEKYLVSQFD